MQSFDFLCLVQCWIQSFRNAGHVTDGAGRRAFALVNRATGKALGRRRGDELVRVRLFPVLSGSIIYVPL